MDSRSLAGWMSYAKTRKPKTTRFGLFQSVLPVNLSDPILTNSSSTISSSNSGRNKRFGMSLESYFQKVMEENRDDLQQIAELEKILDQILPPKEKNQIYLVSVTSNW